jgi:hypothetical protein
MHQNYLLDLFSLRWSGWNDGVVEFAKAGGTADRVRRRDRGCDGGHGQPAHGQIAGEQERA